MHLGTSRVPPYISPAFLSCKIRKVFLIGKNADYLGENRGQIPQSEEKIFLLLLPLLCDAGSEEYMHA